MGIKIDLNKFDWDLINKEHKEGLYWKNVGEKFGIGKNLLLRAEKEGFITKIKHKYKHSEQSKKALSLSMKKYLNDNPDKCVWKRSDKLKSVPCEILKKELLLNGINFVDEFRPLKDRFFSIDIAFPDKKIGIEVNGTQHYNSDGTLKEYYLNRKLDIEKLGWKLFDIHYSNIYKQKFVIELISSLKNEYDLKHIDYSFFIKKPKKKYSSHKEYVNYILDKNFKNTHSIRIDLIKKSNIEFGKIGWKKEAANLLGFSDTYMLKWIKRYMYDFYKVKCFKKISRCGLSKVRKYSCKKEYYDNLIKNSLILTDTRISIIRNFNIDINKKGWSTKLMILFNLSKTTTCKWVSNNRSYILEELKK